MKKAILITCLFLPLMGIGSMSHASDYHIIFSNGIDSGGDPVWVSETQLGGKQSMSIADGVYFMGGIGMTLDSKKVDLQLLMGWKHTAISGLGEKDIRWTRWPIEFLTFYRYKIFRIGLGATYQINPVRAGLDETRNKVIIDANADFNNAIGFISEIGIELNENVVVSSRISALSYKNSSESYSGTGLGMNLKFIF